MSPEYTPVAPPMPTRLLFIHNEHSSHHERSLEAMRELEAADYEVKEVLTSLNQHETDDRIHEQYEPGDAMVASGGDGTAGIALNSLYNLHLNGLAGASPHYPRRPHLEGTYLLYHAAGNANDTARNAHGKVPLLRTLQEGRPMAAYALQTQIEFPSGTILAIHSAGCAGVGGAGRASSALNKVKGWPLHTLWEPLAVWQAVGTHPYFKVRLGDDDQAPLRVNDLTWTNAMHMAKYGLTGAELTEPEAKVFHSRIRGMGAALVRMAKLSRQKLRGHDEKGPLKYTIELDDPDDFVNFYHDGDTLLIPSETILTFMVDQRPYWTLRVPKTSRSQKRAKSQGA